MSGKPEVYWYIAISTLLWNAEKLENKIKKIKETIMGDESSNKFIICDFFKQTPN